MSKCSSDLEDDPWADEITVVDTAPDLRARSETVRQEEEALRLAVLSEQIRRDALETAMRVFEGWLRARGYAWWEIEMLRESVEEALR